MGALIPPHGGYRKLLSYKLAALLYDATVPFVERYIDRRSRTCDQMVQAACSGVANIVEGSEAAATSQKTELKLTNVAKASLEELLFDYQAFLRQRGLPEWPPDSREALEVRNSRPESLAALRRLMARLVKESSDGSDPSDKSDKKAEVAANTMICLVNQCTYLLHRQLADQEERFLREGGFTERLYRERSARREQDKLK
ncbi:MAG: four helix bundle protein [Opitutae bacterium]|nr:four helix bundle protein [Opitutae bacterium]